MLVPDYEHGILSMINTIREYVGISTYHQGDETIKAWLQKHQFQQIVVMLIDGMGAYQVQDYCDKKGFMNSHFYKAIDTVYPPTTAAATTSVLTGKAPCETGWLGWQQYISSVNAHPIMFFNEDYYTEEKMEDERLSYHLFPVITMIEECIQSGMKAKELFPNWRTPGMDSFALLCEEVLKESKSQESKLIYAYWDEYDSFMHDHGATHQDSIAMLRSYDRILEQTMSQLDEHTGLIIIADHGHIDVTCKELIKYPDIMECFEVLPSLESRTVNFFIKEDKKAIFPKLFHEYFQSDFDLYTKQEVIDQKLFGIGEEHELFREMIGDFIACGTGNVCLNYTEDYNLKGHHAGMRQQEIKIPLIMVPALEEC